MKPTRPARWAAAIVTGLAAAMACAAAAAPAALAAPTGIGPVGGSPASLDPHRAGYPPHHCRSIHQHRDARLADRPHRSRRRDLRRRRSSDPRPDPHHPPGCAGTVDLGCFRPDHAGPDGLAGEVP